MNWLTWHFRYPRLYLGWQYSNATNLYCYFLEGRETENPEIQWAARELGSPFPGLKEPKCFKHIFHPRIDCSDELRSTLETATIKSLFKKYCSQERFQNDTPVYEADEDIDTLELWEKQQLDIKDDDNMRNIQRALKIKFGLNVTTEKIKLLTRFGRYKSIFETHTWRQMLSLESKPSAQLTILKRKRAEDDDNNDERSCQDDPP